MSYSIVFGGKKSVLADVCRVFVVLGRRSAKSLYDSPFHFCFVALSLCCLPPAYGALYHATPR